jgi:hypothetical protein
MPGPQRKGRQKRSSSGTFKANHEEKNDVCDQENDMEEEPQIQEAIAGIVVAEPELGQLGDGLDGILQVPRFVDSWTQTSYQWMNEMSVSERKAALTAFANQSGSFRRCASNGQSEMLLTGALLKASSVIDEHVSAKRTRNVCLKELIAIFGPRCIDRDLLRCDATMRGMLMELVELIKENLVQKMKAEVPSRVFCISMDESNKKGDDKMLIVLSYAKNPGRIEYICLGAVSCATKKADESYRHVISKALLEFDPSGDIYIEMAEGSWLRNG